MLFGGMGHVLAKSEIRNPKSDIRGRRLYGHSFLPFVSVCLGKGWRRGGDGGRSPDLARGAGAGP